MKNALVIIVEDDAPLREGLTEWLSPDYEVIGYESAEDFLSALNNFEFELGIPTCILLDFQMPGMTGVELQSTLRLMNVEFPIIFMSGNAKHADIIEAWRGGAIDFLLKPFSSDEVSSALDSSLSKSVQLQLKPSKTVDTTISPEIPITHREAQVLLLLGQGYRQSEAARMLNITIRTIKMHRGNLKNKLSLCTLFELTRYCDSHRSDIQKIAKMS
jgi:FixJ family two-component response regulator